MNDLPNIVSDNNLVMFADDNSYLCAKDNKIDVIENVQTMLHRFVLWFKANKLFLNTDKTVFIKFTPRSKVVNESLLIKNNGKSLTQVNTVKFLGIYIDNNLGWESHVDALCKKLAPACYAIYRLNELSNKEIMLSYYYAQFHSRLRYGILFWGCSHQCSRVFRLQKRAVRSIMGVLRLTSCRDLFKKLKLLCLPCIYILEILLFVRQNQDKFITNSFYHNYNTRGGQNYCLPLHNLAISENHPVYMGILMYNKLPEYIKNEQNLKCFKKIVKDLLIRECFYSISEFLNYRFSYYM